MKNKIHLQIKKHQFLHLRVYFLETGRVTIPKINTYRDTFIHGQGSFCSQFRRIHQPEIIKSYGNYFVYRRTKTALQHNMTANFLCGSLKM